MDTSADINALSLQAQTWALWALEQILSPWVALQVAILIFCFLLARLIARPIVPRLENRMQHWRVPVGLKGLTKALPSVLVPLIFIAILGLIALIMLQMTWPSRSYLVRVATSLTIAWVVIRLASTFVRSRFVAKSLAILVWAMAALTITGLMDPTITALDQAAISFGSFRLSLLAVLKGAMTLMVLLWLAGIAARFMESRITSMADLTPSVQVLMSKVTKILLIVVAVVIGLQSMGIDLTALTVFSGAIGVGLGFGLQKVVSNLISGVILLMDKSVKPGDVIEIDQTYGRVNTMGARYISVTTRDNKEYLIPNEDLITTRVVNWSHSSTLIRLEVQFGVSYGSNPHQVRELAVNACRELDRVEENPKPVCHMSAFGDSSLDFKLRFWIRDPEGGVVNVKGLVFLALWDAFQEHNINIPFPHRELIVHRPDWLAEAKGAEVPTTQGEENPGPKEPETKDADANSPRQEPSPPE